MANVVWVDVTVRSGAAVSDFVTIPGKGIDGEFAVCAVALPADIDGTSAGIEWSFDGTTVYAPLSSAGDSLTFTIADAAASKNGLVMLDPVNFSITLPYFRMFMGSSATADRTYKVGFRKV